MRGPAVGLPGEVALARVANLIENPAATGKVRPVVLVQRQGPHWRSMGLTSRRCYRDGEPRTAVPNPTAIGLHGPGYLWGRRLVAVGAGDIYEHLGWIDADLAAAIIVQARLDRAEAADLIRAVTSHAAAA